MPESKADQAQRSNEEIVNFVEYGDARGPKWLEAHPEGRTQAEQHRQMLAELRNGASQAS